MTGLSLLAVAAHLVFPVPGHADWPQTLHVRQFDLLQSEPQSFAYSCRAKGALADPATPPSHSNFGVEICVRYMDGSKAKWTGPKTRLRTDAPDWQDLSAVFHPPRAVSNVTFYCRLARKGEAWFDGVSVEELPRDVPHGACSVREADGLVTLENDFLRFAVEPAKGGAGLSLVTKADGVEWSSRDPLYRFCLDRFRTGGRTANRTYQPRIVRDTAGEVSLALALTGPQGYGFIQVEKTFTLRRDSSALEVGYAWRNLPEAMGEAVVEPWFKLSLMPGGVSDQRLFLPTAHGVVGFGPTGGDTYPKDVTSGWIAAGDGRGRTLAVEFDYAHFASSYLWLGGVDRLAAEWCFQPVAIPAGGTFATALDVFPAAGLGRPDGVENGIAAEFASSNGCVAVRFAAARTYVLSGSVAVRRSGRTETAHRVLKLRPGVTETWVTPLATEGMDHVRVSLADEGAIVFEAERAKDPAYVYPPRKEKAKPAELKPFSLELSGELTTPHVPWFRPSAGGRVKALFICDLRQQREIVELAERMDLDARTIRICEHSDVMAWGMIERYNAFTYTDANVSLADRLREGGYDAVVLSGRLWKHVDEPNRAKIRQLLSGGAGLVVVNDAQLLADEGYRPDTSVDLVRGVPRELLPFGAERVSAFGRGTSRAVLCRFDAKGGLTPFVPYDVAEPRFRYADYALGVFARALRWAAKREVARPADAREDVSWEDVEPGFRIRRSVVRDAAGRAHDFSCAVERAPKPAKIVAFDVADAVDGIVKGEARASGGQVRVELRDGYGRLVATADGGTFALPVDGALTTGLRATATVRLDGKVADEAVREVRTDRAPPEPDFAFSVGESAHRGGVKRYLLPLRYAQFRAGGANQLRFWWCEDAKVHLPFLRYGFGLDFPIAFDARLYGNTFATKFGEPYAKTKDRAYLCRRPCYHDPDFWTSTVARVERAIDRLAANRAVSYDCGDENSLTLWSTPFDFCFGEHTLRAFREWLKGEYADLCTLNAAWGTAFASWDAVTPDTTPEARERARRTGRRAYGAWADHRRFMELTYAGYFAMVKDVMRRKCPGLPLDMSGTQQPDGWTGMDMWLIGQSIDIPAAYDVNNVAEIVRSFGRPLVKPWYGYGSSGLPMRRRVWYDAFRFPRYGVSFYTSINFLQPDFTLPVPVKDLNEELADLRDGGARLLRTVEPECEALVHYSQASIHAAQIEERYADFLASRERWCRTLDACGVGYRFVAYAQIEQGELRRTSAKTLVLPMSAALSAREAEEIRAFAVRGGRVVGEPVAGTMDEHCRTRETNPLAGIVSPEHGFGPAATDGVRLFRYRLREGTDKARFFGFVRELDVRPAVAEREVRLDEPAWVYDLRKKTCLGRRSAFKTSLAAGGATFFAALPYEVKGLSATVEEPQRPGGEVVVRLKLSVAGGEAAYHPVKVEVTDATGRRRDEYAGLADVVRGEGTYRFRTALDDPKGPWRIRATDFISGKQVWRSVGAGR